MYNVAIIGAGPAGIFSALEIIKLRPEWKVILIEKGQKIEKRKCPIREGSPKCVNCKRCGWVSYPMVTLDLPVLYRVNPQAFNAMLGIPCNPHK